MSDEVDIHKVSLRQKLYALYGVAAYRSQSAAGIGLLSTFSAMLEGVLIAVIKIGQGQMSPSEIGGIGQIFVSPFEFVGVPSTLEWVIVGIALVMVARSTATFLVAWLRARVQTHYIRYFQTDGFEIALNARIAHDCY